MASAKTANVIAITQLDAPIELSPLIEVLEDPNKSLTYKILSSSPAEFNWQLPTTQVFSGKNLNSRYWFRITLNFQQDFSTQNPVLFIPVQACALYELDLWLPDDLGRVRLVQTGFLRPFFQRDKPSFQYAFDLPKAKGVYTIIGSVYQAEAGFPLLLPFQLLSEEQFDTEYLFSLGLMVSFYAVMSALLLYNACLFVSIREAVYGCYLLFLSTAMFVCMLIDGTMMRFVWPQSATMNAHLVNVVGILLAVFYLGFVQEALGRLLLFPTLRKIFRALAVIAIVAAVANVFSSSIYYSSVTVQIISAVVLPVTLFSIVNAVFHRQSSAIYLLVAELCAISGGTAFMLVIQGVLPLNHFTLWLLHGGYLAEALLLSLALADRTNRAIQAQLTAQNLALDNEKKAHAAMEIATKAKNEFLASVSHELRTPLTSIIGFTENLIEKQLITNAGKEQIHTVLRSGKQLLYVIDDILNLSLIDNHKVNITPQIVATDDLLLPLRTKYRLIATQKGIHYEIDISDDLPTELQIDLDHAQQILHQIITNALKFTDRGKVSVKVNANQALKRLEFFIADSGIGMSAEQLARLFEPFSQLDGSDTRRFSVTGVGLFIAKSLTELMGGTIAVESSMRVGTRFKVVFPYEVIEGHAHIMQPSVSNRPGDNRLESAAIPSLSGRVLYAEDNEDNHRLVKLMVEATGAQLQHVHNGAEAVDAVLGNPVDYYDLVLMDIQMPVLDGVSATQQIKAVRSKTPIIAFSASAMKNAIYENIGFNGFISKPISRSKLYAVLTIYLKSDYYTEESFDSSSRQQLSTAIEKSVALPQAGAMQKAIWDFSDRDLLIADEEIAPLLLQFEANLSLELSHCQQQIELQNWANVRSCLHQFKGAAGGYGHMQLSQLAAEAENKLKKNNMPEFLQTMLDIQSYIKQIEAISMF